MEEMFKKSYKLTGTHATKTRQLSYILDDRFDQKLYSTFISAIIDASLVGFLYGTKAEKNEADNDELSIKEDTVSNYSQQFKYNFRLILLSDKEYEPDLEKRIDKAFRGNKLTLEDEELFHSYVRGGIDILYKKLIEDCDKAEDYSHKIRELLEEMRDFFYKDINNTDILKLANNIKTV